LYICFLTKSVTSTTKNIPITFPVSFNGILGVYTGLNQGNDFWSNDDAPAPYSAPAEYSGIIVKLNNTGCYLARLADTDGRKCFLMFMGT